MPAHNKAYSSDIDTTPESVLMEAPHVHYRQRIDREAVDPEREAYVDAAVARSILRRLAQERGHDQ